MLTLLGRAHRLVTRIALGALSGLVLVLAAAWLTGWSVQVVRTDSMEPSIPKGAAVLVRPASFFDLQVGDVAMYSDGGRDGAMVLHRVAEVVDRGEYIRTRGDASQSVDRLPVAADAVRGEYVATLARLGPVAGLLTDVAGKAILVSGALVLAIAGEALAMAERRRRRTVPVRVIPRGQGPDRSAAAERSEHE